MQGIYNYMPEKNHVYRVHTVAAVRYLQFVLHACNNNNNTTEPNPVDYYIPGWVNISQIKLIIEKFDYYYYYYYLTSPWNSGHRVWP